MKYLRLALVSLLLSGCSLVVGRHPDRYYDQRYCLPCVEATRKFGAGLIILPEEEKWYKKVALFWDYNNFWKKVLGLNEGE